LRKHPVTGSNSSIRPSAGLLLFLMTLFGAAHGQAPDGDRILKQAREAYQGLGSYSDHAQVLAEMQLPGGPLTRERHEFTTAYRAPRDFVLIFEEDPAAGADRYVLWSDADAVYTWWSATGVTESYPPGTGLSAFGVSAFPTRAAVLQILPLIFADTGLSGPIVDVASATLDGEEDVDGHPCYRLQGVGRSGYATGGGETLRRTTLWIDKRSFLVRRVFQDTQEGGLAGAIDRQTTTFEPQGNPELGDDDFRFAPPRSP
jgi:outer membrane lipoprotein-sorting protein